MSALPKPMSLDEFIAWEERQDGRHEYDGIATRAMTGGTYAHARIQANLVRQLGNRLAGGPCFALGSELKLRTATSVRYPDGMVVCAGLDDKATWTEAPTVAFEILSARSAPIDLGDKTAEYKTIATLRRYVVIHQDAVAAQVFYRDEAGEWTYEFVAATGDLAMPEIAATIPLLTLYEGLAVGEPS